jgi:murein DD-endopeptidase MepM/ murein hydrolase activator NlpD
MPNSQKQTLIQILFVDLKNKPFKNLYHEVRKSGEQYALSAGNSDGQGLGVWIKQPVGTHLDIVVRHPISKKMIPAHQYIIVPDKKGKIRIQAPFYIEEKNKLQPRQGEQGDYLRKTHTVKKGETLTSIAKQHGTDWQILFNLNRDKIKDPDEIRVGDVIKVPPKNKAANSTSSSSGTSHSPSTGHQAQSGTHATSSAGASTTSSKTPTPSNQTPNPVPQSQPRPQPAPQHTQAVDKTPSTTASSGGILDKAGELWDSTKESIESGVEWVDKTTQPVQDAVVNKVGEMKEGIENAVSSHGTSTPSTQPPIVTPTAQPAPQATKSPVQQHNPVTTTNTQQRGQTETPKIVSTTTGSCVCKDYNLIWSGHPNVTCEFRKKVVQICKDLWPENYLQMANNLMACMALETGRTFRADKANGKGYYGLIQFGKDACTDLTTTTEYIRKLSAIEQLDWVKKYFALRGRQKYIKSFVDLYITILYPEHLRRLGRSAQDNDVLFDYKKDAYRDNPGFFQEKGEKDRVAWVTNKKGKQVKEYLGFEHGSTKVWEVAQVNQQFYDEGLLPKNRDFKPSCAKAVAPPIVREQLMQGWQNPLKYCQVRRFGYKSLPLRKGDNSYNKNYLNLAVSVASAFKSPNPYRSSGKHQGLDLEAEPNTPIYAVCKGKVVFAGTYGSGKSYGKAIIIQCNVSDLPLNKQQILRQKLNFRGELVYFTYCHLNKIHVSVKDMIDDTNFNQPIGLSGNTGNAGSMTSIAKGAHLHFEIRDNITASMRPTGLQYRYDPFPLINNCYTTENGVK